MKIPIFVEVRNNPFSKKRYYLFEPELKLNFLDNNQLKICRASNEVVVSVLQGDGFINIAGAYKKEINVDSSTFFNFMGSDIFIDNFDHDCEKLFCPTGLFFQSEAMKKTYDEINMYARDEDTLFIFGETGTGKELIARNIHYNSRRKHHPFVVVNACCLDSDRANCELFGNVRGAFTNAEIECKGSFFTTGKGTLVIDEIGNIPVELQPKLLRAIEYKEIKAVGSDKVKIHNSRVIIISNESPDVLLNENKIREDLYYRIEKSKIIIPPLRERRDDIELLARFFAGQDYRITDNALNVLIKHNWPGNVRELKHCIERSKINLKGKIIDSSAISLTTLDKSEKTENFINEFKQSYLWRERELIKAILLRNDWNISKSSRDMGIARGTLISKIKNYRLIH